MLDEVAWLMNLRGSDVQCNPVFLSYATVPLEGPAKLYLEGAKLTEEVKAHLKESEVEVMPYGRMVPDLEAAVGAGSKLLLDPSKVSYALYQAAVNKGECIVLPLHLLLHMPC
jgi:Xaa-Pro aminopeptidase